MDKRVCLGWKCHISCSYEFPSNSLFGFRTVDIDRSDLLFQYLFSQLRRWRLDCVSLAAKPPIDKHYWCIKFAAKIRNFFNPTTTWIFLIMSQDWHVTLILSLINNWSDYNGGKKITNVWRRFYSFKIDVVLRLVGLPQWNRITFPSWMRIMSRTTKLTPFKPSPLLCTIDT